MLWSKLGLVLGSQVCSVHPPTHVTHTYGCTIIPALTRLGHNTSIRQISYHQVLITWQWQSMRDSSYRSVAKYAIDGLGGADIPKNLAGVITLRFQADRRPCAFLRSSKPTTPTLFNFVLKMVPSRNFPTMG
ncbi:hypothetical protein EDB85DRAFT_1921735 [Lactarius pseudohatsudake]|nr:hypothetical protein EDB85DRAFT_1921735 [Lactarius pseudohatsudake]